MSPFRALLRSLRDTAGPTAAVELTAGHVAGAAIEFRSRGPVVAQHAIEPLADGALAPSLTSGNIRDRRGVADALGRVLDGIGRPGRIALVLPDPVAKVSIVKFEHVPARGDDLDQLVRWQARKTAPFPIEEAQVGYVPGVHSADGSEFIVTLAKRDVILEYEDLCAQAGAHAGVVDLATLNVINLVLAEEAAAAGGDWLLVNVARDYATIAILNGPHLIFFRNRTAEGEGSLADLVHQSAMYYEDRLNGAGFRRAFLVGAGVTEPSYAVEIANVQRMIEERLRLRAEPVDPRRAAAFTDRIAAGPALLDALAPLVGVLLRDRERAA